MVCVGWLFGCLVTPSRRLVCASSSSFSRTELMARRYRTGTPPGPTVDASGQLGAESRLDASCSYMSRICPILQLQEYGSTEYRLHTAASCITSQTVNQCKEHLATLRRGSGCPTVTQERSSMPSIAAIQIVLPPRRMWLRATRMLGAVLGLGRTTTRMLASARGKQRKGNKLHTY